MRLWVKILLAVFLCFALIFVSTYVFFVFKGKSLIIRKLEDLTKRKVTVEEFSIDPPLSLRVRGLEISGLAKAESITASPNIFALVTGSVVLDEVKIVQPQIIYERSSSLISQANPDNPALSLPVSSYLQRVKKKHFFTHFQVKRISLSKGRLDFLDRSVNPEGIRLVFKNLSLTLQNNYSLTGSLVSAFDLKADIPWQKGETEGKVRLEGWIDFSKRNMEAQVKVEDIDGVYLYPYYSEWVDLDKSRVEKANLDFSSNIHGLNNNVTAECHLELTDIVFKPLEQATKGREEAIASAVIDIFKAMDQGKIVLNFVFKTKMDRPEFGFSQIKMAFQDKITKAKGPGIKPQDVAVFPLRFMESVVTGFRDLSKAVISGTVAVGNELGKVVQQPAEE